MAKNNKNSKVKVTITESIVDENTIFRNKETDEEYYYRGFSDEPFQKYPKSKLFNIKTKEIEHIEVRKLERVN